MSGGGAGAEDPKTLVWAYGSQRSCSVVFADGVCWRVDRANGLRRGPIKAHEHKHFRESHSP